MKKTFALLALAAFVAVPTVASADQAPQVSVVQGKTLYSTGGKRIAAIYRVAADGSPQVILDGKLVTVPVSSLTLEGGKPTTSLSKKELRSLR